MIPFLSQFGGCFIPQVVFEISSQSINTFYFNYLKKEIPYRILNFVCHFIIMMLSNHVQRVLEQRVSAILDKLLVKPSLVNLPPVEEGGLLLVSRSTEFKLFLITFEVIIRS